MKFSWEALAHKKIFSVLAPMEDVTDTVFRQIVATLGAPDVFFTEFTNLEGLFSPGSDKVAQRLRFTDLERPLVAQIWGLNPKLYELGAQKLELLGFNGIDINMGCPEKSVVKSGACSGLINNPSLAKEIVLATQTGAKQIPVSIKTRLGFNTIMIEEWLGFLLELKPKALTIHLRTVKEMSKVPAHFEVMQQISKLRDQISPKTVLIVNGDINSISQGESLCNDTHFEGMMIGRGALKNPLVFAKEDINLKNFEYKMTLLKTHVQMFDQAWGENKNYDTLKKYFKIYVNNFDGAGALREKLMKTKNVTECLTLLQDLSIP